MNRHGEREEHGRVNKTKRGKREKKRERWIRKCVSLSVSVCLCVCVWVGVREREYERGSEMKKPA